ncbi:hypothetical protein [Nesterenkonia suensis]
MTAENPEQGDGGADLRARYLPVSRKELRRRREAELAAQSAGEQSVGAVTEGEDAADGDAPAAEEAPAAPARPVSASSLVDEDTQTASTPVISDGQAEPSAEDAVEDADLVDETEFDDAPGEAVDSADEDSDPEDSSASTSPTESEVLEDASDVAESAADERPQDDLADEMADSTETGLETLGEGESQGGDLRDEDADVVKDEAASEDEAEAEDEDEAEDEAEDPDEETAPIPASRRARRLLRETGSLDALTDERLREIDQLTAEITARPEQDPQRVDPELLKKQQAMAAKAMQANQERRRKELEDEARERARRRHERPESEIITRKALRAYVSSDDPEHLDVATGEIDPVEARGAHGLDLDDMVEHTSRQASRQAVLLWLVIVLAALLLITVGVVLFSVL